MFELEDSMERVVHFGKFHFQFQVHLAFIGVGVSSTLTLIAEASDAISSLFRQSQTHSWEVDCSTDHSIISSPNSDFRDGISTG